MVLSKEWTEKVQVLIVVLIAIFYLFIQGTRSGDNTNPTTEVTSSHRAITEPANNVADALQNTTRIIFFETDGGIF